MKKKDYIGKKFPLSDLYRNKNVVNVHKTTSTTRRSARRQTEGKASSKIEATARPAVIDMLARLSAPSRSLAAG